MQISGILLAIHTAESIEEQQLKHQTGRKRQQAPRYKELAFRFRPALGLAEFEVGVDDDAVQYELAGVGDSLCADALPNKNIGKSIQALPHDIQPQRK